MNMTLVRELFDQIDSLPILDVHTHVDWRTGTARNIGDILSYHYYTELANSADYCADKLPLDDPEGLTRVVLSRLGLIRNTVQYDWLMSLSRDYLGLEADEWYPDNWRFLFDRSVEVMGRPEWRDELIAQANLERVFLTNQYNEDLDGLDTTFYTPCLRTESFVVQMDSAAERDGFAAFLGRPVRETTDVVALIDKVFAEFVSHGMGYAALSSLANVVTADVSSEDAQRVLDKMIGGTPLTVEERDLWMAYALARICDACRKYDKPFHFMVGVDRGVYQQGVPGGQDLFDSANSMRGYDYLFNAYPDVRFPTSVLSDTTGLELAAAAWIRHNVYPSGHWWYGNQPVEMAREIRRRLDTVPGNKIIGYYSDAYYLEFIPAKFRMYKFELALALAERMERSLVHPNMGPFTLEDALLMAEDLLINNPTRVLGIEGL